MNATILKKAKLAAVSDTRKLQTYVLNEHGWKHSQEDTSKLSPNRHHKDHTSQSSGVYPTNTSLVQHSQINKCHMSSHQQNKE